MQALLVLNLHSLIERYVKTVGTFRSETVTISAIFVQFGTKS